LIASLENLGYLLDTSETAMHCAVYLDEKTLGSFPNKTALVEWIERTPGPLVRLSPWPNGVRSVLCITADLDALSLMDYAARLTVR